MWEKTRGKSCHYTSENHQFMLNFTLKETISLIDRKKVDIAYSVLFMVTMWLKVCAIKIKSIRLTWSSVGSSFYTSMFASRPAGCWWETADSGEIPNVSHSTWRLGPEVLSAAREPPAHLSNRRALVADKQHWQDNLWHNKQTKHYIYVLESGDTFQNGRKNIYLTVDSYLTPETYFNC